MAIRVPVIFELSTQGSVSGAISAAKKNLIKNETLTDKLKPASGGGANLGLGKMNLGIDKIAGGFGKLLPTMMKMAGIAFTMYAILSSSKSLQRVLERFGKMFEMIFRPIGDTIATILMPVMMAIRPLVMLLNTIMRPFIQEARRSFMLSSKYARMAGEASDLGMSEEASRLSQISSDLAMTGLATLGVGLVKAFGNFFGEIIKMAAGAFIDIQAALLSSLPGFSAFKDNIYSAAETAKGFVNAGIDGALKLLNESANGFLENVKAKNNAAQELATYVGEFLSNAKEVTGLDPTKVSQIQLDINGLLNIWDSAKALSSKTAWEQAQVAITNTGTLMLESQNKMIEKAKELYAISNGLTAQKIPTVSTEKEGNFLTQGFGFLGTGSTAVVEFGATLLDMAGLITKNEEQFDKLYNVSYQLGQGYSMQQASIIANNGSLESYNAEITRHNEQLNLTTGSLNSFQQAVMDAHGEGGHGLVELQVEIAKNIVSMMNFESSTVNAIRAIDSAVGNARNFMMQAQSFMAQAQSAANSARASASSNKNNTKKVNDLIITSDGRTFETAPDDNIFATKGGMGGKGVTINLNIGTIQALNSDDVKRKLDELVRDNLRKYA